MGAVLACLTTSSRVSGTVEARRGVRPTVANRNLYQKVARKADVVELDGWIQARGRCLRARWVRDA